MEQRELLAVGYVSGAYGIKGWVKIRSFFENGSDIAEYPLQGRQQGGPWRVVKIESIKSQGKGLVAKFEGCNDRTAAELLRGTELGINPDILPQLGDGDYYWQDLLGLRVINTAGVELGLVADMLETGANDVLVVKSDSAETLIPWVLERYVVAVDMGASLITVDWDADY